MRDENRKEKRKVKKEMLRWYERVEARDESEERKKNN